MGPLCVLILVKELVTDKKEHGWYVSIVKFKVQIVVKSETKYKRKVGI